MLADGRERAEKDTGGAYAQVRAVVVESGTMQKYGLAVLIVTRSSPQD